MKENIFEVLVYLFENYMIEDSELQPMRNDIESELVRAGFTQTEISKAFIWLEDLSDLCEPEALDADHLGHMRIRHYHPYEQLKINIEIRGLLHTLEQSRMISASLREVIIDRILALDIDERDSEKARWVIMMVLCNCQDEGIMLDTVESLVFNDIQKH